MSCAKVAMYASIVLILLASVTSIMALVKKKETTKFWLGTTVFLVIGLGVVQLIERIASHYAGVQEASRSATWGKLEPVTLTFQGKGGRTKAKVQIGGSFLLFNCGPDKTPAVTEKDAEYPGLQMRQINGKVHVSHVVRDASGRIVAIVDDNEWYVNPNRSLDRNYTSTALEVKDSQGFVVLQLRLLEDRIQAQWRTFISRGQEFLFCKNPDTGGALATWVVPDKRRAGLRIKPMFKYPSAEHLGELVEPEGFR